MANAVPAGTTGDIQRHLSAAQVESLEWPIYTKAIVNTSKGKILLLTRDYGSGLEVRDAYVYRYAVDQWELVAYRRTGNSTIDVRIRADMLELFSGNSTVLAMPVESLFPSARR